jgi:osmoprotectant transport system ATP-binding protein
LRRRIGYVIQEGGLFPHFTIARNVGSCRRFRLGRARTNERVREMLNLVGLDPDRFAERYPRELSGGSVSASASHARSQPIRRCSCSTSLWRARSLTRASLQREFAELARV